MKKTSNYTNKYVNLTNNRILRKLLESPFVGLGTHWVFQGILYMDRTERFFKLGLDLGLMIVFVFILKTSLGLFGSILLGFFLAHTINFLFNGQFWVVLKHYGWVSNSHDNFIQYTKRFTERGKEESAILKILVFGSISRNSWIESSDLDVRVIRLPGVLNGVRASLFITKERSRALFAGIPLDIFLLDTEIPLDKLRMDELAINLLENDCALDQFFDLGDNNVEAV